MEIIVPIRQVPDVALNIRVNDGVVVEDGVSFVISSWDETAIEGALQMTEELGGEVTLLGIGPQRVSEALRKGLAMGAHKAIHVLYEEGQTDSFGYAKIMTKVMEGRNYDMILTGKQAQDTDAGLTASMLAEFLELPQVTNIIRFGDLAADGLTVYRKGDHGTEVLGLKLPAVVTVNDSLNEPRLASMRGIMMAKKKPMESLTPTDLGMNAEELGLQGSMTEVLKFEKPESRKEGERFEGEETETVPMTLQKLVSEAKLAV